MADALARLLEGVSRNELAQRSAAITARYRAGEGSQQAVRDRLDALAYAAARMPATRAAVAQALFRLREAAPDLAPARLLDLGCGAGAATLAALGAFPSIADATLVDRSEPMLALAHDLTQDCGARIATHALDLARDTLTFEADLVTMAYVLVETPTAAAVALALRAFARARLALVLVEPGTPAGFERLRAAREALIAAGAQIAAPCPHHVACPLAAPDWRHFSVRVQRSRDHLAVKAADVPFEDEPFMYIAATRAPVVARGARIVSRPHRDKSGLTTRLCEANGALRDVFVPARDKHATRLARRLDEGDLWPLV
ncbi:MAG: methyltransferase domain-containing protein [Rhizobiales bacterium]|nr:methyltransferase domain-containing protein [Hyphomicrobiales bacterium]